MSYSFSEFVLIRVPLFPIDQFNWPLKSVLEEPAFRAAIYLASPQFFERLAKAGFDPSRMSMREVMSLTRYLNRACYRPVPFGFFASVSMGRWKGAGSTALKESSDELGAFIQTSELVSQKLIGQLSSQDHDQVSYEPNPTLYRVNKSYRFIRAEMSTAQHRGFQLQSSLYSQILKKLLQFCRNGQPTEMIISRIVKDAECCPEDASEYFEFLKDVQILLPKYRAGITGRMVLQQTCRTDYSLYREYRHRLPDVTELQTFKQQFLGSEMPILPLNDRDTVNAVLLRHLESPSIDSKYQEDLQHGFYALDRLCPPDQLPALEVFKQQYLKYFEKERISLLLALDPELGIGYQAEPFESPNPLLETVNIRPIIPYPNESKWSQAHRCLMAAWLEMEKKQQKFISLQEDVLSELPRNKHHLTGLGFSSLFNISNDGLHIETAGGVNPAALIGRFTLADQTIYDAGKKMASHIEQLNPDILFAEILHLTDPHIDNINRREQLWSHQLHLLSGLADERAASLRLDDLYVEVTAGMLYLWSKTHQKYVIPRLTSAYNHSIDQLPLFRFLADLSYQYSRTQLSFDLIDYFPGFHFYPRVVYKQVILSRATWVISTDEIPENHEGKEWARLFDILAEQRQMPTNFVLSEGDQQLVFNRSNFEELRLLQETLRSKKQVIIREYLSARSDGTIINTPTGKHYQVQFTAFMLPDEPLRFPQITRLKAKEQNEQRKFLPGTEWLYLKLYVPRLSVNRLLLQLEPLLKKRFPHGKISRWFFIRYEDHAPHIRLRFKIPPEDIDVVLAALRVILEENIHQHLIREYQLDVYSREIERYQAIGMEETEAFFWYSSSFVLQYIKAVKAGSAIPTYLAAAVTTQIITEGFYKTHEEQLEFWQQTFESYLTEFEDKHIKVALDQKFRETCPTLDQYLKLELPFKEKSLQLWTKKLKIKAADLGYVLKAEPVKKDYLISLIHMHLNRLFTDQARQQEMIIYFLLFKWMRSQVARQKLRPNGQS